MLGPGFGGSEPDAEGMPVYRSELSDHLRQSTQETVLAVYCPQGHVTPAYTPTCRVCATAVPPQDPQRIPRPLLGGLRLPTGELVPLDRGVVFGRRPAAVPDAHDWPHLVHLPQDSTYVSRMHLQIELDGWLVLARDLGSRGGTTLRIPGRLPQRIRANERYVLEPGHALDLADVYEITYEVTRRDRSPHPGVSVSGAPGKRRFRRCLPLRAGMAPTERRGQGGAARRPAQRPREDDVRQRGQCHGPARRPPLHRLGDDGRGDRGRSAVPGDALLPAARPRGAGAHRNPMPVADSISTGIKLASAIETAHRAGIVHRDIKPSNVLVTTYSEPALTDFGIAGGLHEVDGDPDVRISYPWSPPEMLDGRSNGSVASDVYSLGATIWHLLTGRSPFSLPEGDNTTRALTARILHTSPPPTTGETCRRRWTGCFSSAWPSSPRSARRPRSSSRSSLQRIEAAAGLSRHTDRRGGRQRRGPCSCGGARRRAHATRMKPPVVVSSSRPRDRPTPSRCSRHRRDGSVPRSGRSWAPSYSPLSASSCC